MKAHELAKKLLKSENFEVNASIDISTGDVDFDRRIFTESCVGVNNYEGDYKEIIILFNSKPQDNYGKEI